tara:strand:+ start:7459 stop:13935 length:6477 start_codon:yes stop_codon:yes gene_type:complete
MININSIDSSINHLNNLLNKDYVNTTELNTTDYLKDNYYIHVGYYYEKELFEELIHKYYDKNEDIFSYEQIDKYVINNNISYYNKFYIDNPHNDYFLKNIKVVDNTDLSKNNVCDLNISKLLNKNYNFYLFKIEFIRNLYYYISTRDYIDKYEYENNLYYFEIPTKYFISDRNNIVKNSYNNFVKFKVKVYNKKINIIFENNNNITNNLIETIKPILNYHINLITNDTILKLGNLNKYEKIKKYAEEIEKKYDNIRFESNIKILQYLHYKTQSIYTEKFINNYLNIIITNYKSFDSIKKDNITIFDTNNDNDNDNVLNDFVIRDPNENFEDDKEVNIIDNYNDDDNNKIDKNIIKDTNNDILFDDINEKNNTFDKEKKLNTYKNIILSLIIFLSILSLIIVTYLIIKIVSNDFNLIDIILSFVITIIIITVLMLIILYSSDEYLKKFFFLNKEHFTQDTKFSRSQLNAVFNLFDRINNDIPPTEALEPRSIETEDTNEINETSETTENIETKINDELNQNFENIKITELNIHDSKDKLMDLKIDSEDYNNKIEYETMKFQNLEDGNKYSEEELKGKQYISIQKESDITQRKNYIDNLIKERKVITENFTNYVKNSNMLEENYKNTFNDINEKLKNMTSINKYKYIDFDNMFDTTNYEMGSPLKMDNTENNENNEVIDDEYMSYNEEEISKYNYINDIDDLKQVIKGYKLENYIQIKDNLLDTNIDILKLNQQTLDEIRNANITNQMDIVMDKLETTKKLIELSKMIAAINMNKKINIQIEIESEEDKLNNSISEYRNNYEDIVALKNNINSDNELKNKIKNDIDLYVKSIETISTNMLKLNKKIEDDEKKKTDYTKYYDYTFDKIKQINMDKIEKDLLQTEKIKNLELYEMNNLELFDSKIGMEIVNNKYKINADNKELFKIKEYELEIDNKYKNIKFNYEKQIEYFTKLQKENVKDELFRMKIETKKTTIDSSNKINNEHHIVYKTEIKNFNEILEKDVITQKNTKKNLLILKNSLETKNQNKRQLVLNIEELKSIDTDENADKYKNEIFNLEKKNLEIYNYTIEFNKLNLKNEQIIEKIKNNKIEIQKIKNRNHKSNKLYDNMINNNKKEYELLVIQENFNLRKRNLLLIEVSKIIKEINDDKENIILIMNKKVELIKKLNNNFKNNYDILVTDKTILEKQKNNNNKNLENILETTCLLFNKVDNNITIKCDKKNIEVINLKINELLESDLIKDDILKTKLINIKTNNTLINEKAVYITMLIFKYELDINTNMIKNIVKEINVNDLQINLNNSKIDKLEFNILYKNVFKATLDNENKRIKKVIKNLLDKRLEYKKEYQNTEDILDNYNIKKKLENEINNISKNIDYNKKKEEDFTKHITNVMNEINKLNKQFLKIKDELNYDTKKIVDKKFQKIELLTNKFSEYYTLISKFVEFKDKYKNINLSKYIFIPIILDDTNKKQIYNLFDDNEKEFKKYISNDTRYQNLKNMVDNITNIVVIDKDNAIQYAKVVIKFNLNYNMFDNKEFNINQFKLDIINTLSSTLMIDKKFINIISISNNENILLNVNIEINEKYTSQQEIVDFLKKQVSNKNSELKKNKYGKNIIELISNIKEIEDSILNKTELCDGNITMPNYISDIKIEGDYFDDIFKYCNVEIQKNVLLLYLPLITKDNALDNTLLDYSIYGRTVYEAMCQDVSIRKIYKNYIELDKTLLKIDNINLIDRNEYTISFISKLNETNPNKQHILFSNGQINQTFNLTLDNDNVNKINWESYFNNEKHTFYNNNLLTIGFMNKHLYINLPCSNDKYFSRITDVNSDKLYVNENEWCHWIITKKNNKINIYKNLNKVFEQNLQENSIDKDKCNTNSNKYDKKTLYIGGIKTDLDSNTKILNDLVCYKGNLKDFRIYEIELTHDDISKIFINNCNTENANNKHIDTTLTETPELTENSYIENSEASYTGALTTDTENKQISEKNEKNENEKTEYKILNTYDTNVFEECNMFTGNFTYVKSKDIFECIQDNMPCFDKDDIAYYDDDKNTKYCINDKKTKYSDYNFSNTKINEVEFNKIYSKYDGNSYNIHNNFGCPEDSSKKNIYNMTDKGWQCMQNNNEFQCHDNNYNYQLPIKKHNGEYDCISKNDTGNYYDNKILYNQLKNKLADNIV